MGQLWAIFFWGGGWDGGGGVGLVYGVGHFLFVFLENNRAQIIVF